jgi:spore coat protein H
MKKLSALLLIGACSMLSVFAQVAPPFGEVFDQTEVTSIYITIQPDSLQEMIANLESEHEYPAQFVFQSNGLNDTVNDIGFRLRGNTSINAAKKSFKISFNTFNAGGQWQDLEKINLLATVNDPSLMRSKLSHDLFRKFGIAAARTSYTRLYINNEYRGVYLNVEHIDEQMASAHFDDQGDGNLYKCTYPADLNFISNNPQDYQAAVWGEQPYDLSTNDYLYDYSDLSHFINVLNNTPTADLSCELPAVFHVSEYLKIAAIDVLLGNWDNYSFLKNNFYLYHDQLTDRMRFIPYDLDNTLGIDWIGIDWANRSVYTWSMEGEARPLYTRLMQNTAYRNLFSQHIEELCNTHFHPDTLAQQIDYWQNLLQPHVAEDTYYPLDFGYDMNTFLQAPQEGCCNHVPYGILAYAEARRASALNQLESYSTGTDAHWVVQRIDTNAVSLSARVEGAVNSVQANYSWDGVSFVSGSMTDDDGDGVYHFNGPLFSNQSDKLYYRIIINGNSVFPCEPEEHWITRSPIGLRINEVCAVNDALVADAFGEYDDWIELYNTSNSALLLQDCFLSDNPENWNRWKLPDTTIAAHGFLIFWADDDLEQGRAHTNFKLGANEPLFVYRTEEGLARLVDRAQGFSPISDATWALTEDGGSNAYVTNEFQTPGYSNVVNSASAIERPTLQLYPNPAADFITLKGCRNAVLLDATGRCVLSNLSTGTYDITALAAGVYTLIEDENRQQLAITR